MTLRECVMACARDREYVENWARLRNLTVAQFNRDTGLYFRLFVRDVHDLVFSRMARGEPNKGGK